MSKTHVEKFIDSCSNDQMMTILRYIRAQKLDQLDNILARAKPNSPIQEGGRIKYERSWPTVKNTEKKNTG